MYNLRKLTCKIIVLAGVLFCSEYSAMAQSIGLVTAGGGQGFFGDVERGARQAGKELGITIYVRGVADEADAAGQRMLVNYMIQKGCQGLIIAPNSNERKKDVAELRAKGIFTVYIDREIGGERISVVSTDNLKAGELAGKEMAKALKEKGRVAVFPYKRGVQTTSDREKGFIKAAVEAGLEVVIYSYLGTTVGEAREKVMKIFKKETNPDGIFTPNESTTKGTIYSLRALDKAGKIVHIGFDSSPIIIKALESNRMYGIVVQRPFQMGYVAVNTLYDAMQHKTVKDKINTGMVFVNRDNIHDAKIREILGLREKDNWTGESVQPPL